MATIIPSILEKTASEFQKQLTKLDQVPEIKKVHIDFCDNTFVPNNTLPLSQLPELPKNYVYELHWMSSTIPDYDLINKLGFETLMLHIEAFSAQEMMKVPVPIATAIGPHSPINKLDDYKEFIGLICLMGIEPGFQGQPFLESTYERLYEIKKKYPTIYVEVDGGVNLSTIGKLASLGADFLNCGSSLMKQPDIVKAYRELAAECKIQKTTQ